eukprot:m51a1_g3227 hypothetical protein (308) ;mRNA; r:88482-89701
MRRRLCVDVGRRPHVRTAPAAATPPRADTPPPPPPKEESSSLAALAAYTDDSDAEEPALSASPAPAPPAAAPAAPAPPSPPPAQPPAAKRPRQSASSDSALARQCAEAEAELAEALRHASDSGAPQAARDALLVASARLAARAQDWREGGLTDAFFGDRLGQLRAEFGAWKAAEALRELEDVASVAPAAAAEPFINGERRAMVEAVSAEEASRAAKAAQAEAAKNTREERVSTSRLNSTKGIDLVDKWNAVKKAEEQREREADPQARREREVRKWHEEQTRKADAASSNPNFEPLVGDWHQMVQQKQ